MSKKKTQKIIIPKGTVDPNEDTLIEIPLELKGNPIVVAKKMDVAGTSKNAEFEANRFSVSDDHSKTKSVKGRSFFSSRKRQNTSNASIPVAPNDYEGVDKPADRKEQEETTYFDTRSSNISDTSAYRTNEPFVDTSRRNSTTKIVYGKIPIKNQPSKSQDDDEIRDTSEKPRRSCLSPSVSCDKSLQCQASKTQSDGWLELFDDTSRRSSTTKIVYGKIPEKRQLSESQDDDEIRETSEKPRRSCLSTNVSCDETLQCQSSKTQNDVDRSDTSRRSLTTKIVDGKIPVKSQPSKSQDYDDLRETSEKPRRSSLSTSVSCDKSVQCKSSKTQSVDDSFPCRKKREPVTDVLYRSSSFDLEPPFCSTKKSISRECKSKTSQVFEDENDKRITFKQCQGADAPCQNPPCIKYGKQLKESKEIESRSSFAERGASVRPRKSKETCKTCDKFLKMSSIITDSCDFKREYPSESQDRLKKLYKNCQDAVDDVYIEQLKRQFEEAKRKLEDAVMLAALSLKQMGSKKYSRSSYKEPSSKAASICDSVPERDMSGGSLYRNQPSFDVYVPTPNKSACRAAKQEETFPKAGPSKLSDAYKNREMYRNIITKKSNDDLPPMIPIQRGHDSPCPFLKMPSLNRQLPRSYSSSKDTNTQTERKIYGQTPEIQSGTSRCSGRCSAPRL